MSKASPFKNGGFSDNSHFGLQRCPRTLATVLDEGIEKETREKRQKMFYVCPRWRIDRTYLGSTLTPTNFASFEIVAYL